MLDKTTVTVKEILLGDAKDLIMKYEWLPTFGNRMFKAYGLFINGKVIGAVSYSRPYTKGSAEFICGLEYSKKMCILGRGVCEPNSPHNASSYLISKSLKLLAEATDYRIVMAYADERAGEIGTVYQAASWMYIGTTKKHYEFEYDGKVMHGKSARSYAKRHGLKPPSKFGKEFAGISPIKHRYIKFIGDKSDKKQLMKLLKVNILNYPKRNDNMPKHKIAKIKLDDERKR